ncbi:putative inorganic phosphate cotransporter [Paramacrobiotus metropolitanus]|uniref:putative inorganic phosphate cotransporter n=1 Tax=Paramacrobiotus metropolitanus TaxID=2943436 RepID=UPI0024458C42|nr:putative inorganic phosphate cotransporter [Paramacrobiotus metropolitanus]
MMDLAKSIRIAEAPKKGSRQAGIVPTRYVFALASFFGMLHLYALRVNMSVAIVAMVNSTSIAIRNQTLTASTEKSYGTTCPLPVAMPLIHGVLASNGEFNWNGTVRGVVLGSFFYGYIFTCYLGGWLAIRCGGKHVFGFSVLFGGVLTLCIPWAARTHYGVLIAVRVLQGIINGVCFPAMETLISSWSPSEERTKFIGFIFSGMHIGMMLMFAVSGYLISLWGWPSIFYVFGVSACLWFAIWTLYIYETPFAHPDISSVELELITKDAQNSEPEQRSPLPWWKPLTSVPFLAAAIAHFGGNWGFVTLLTNLPTYLHEILHFSLKSNGLLSALPYLAVTICIQIFSIASDWLRQRGYMSTTNVRKVTQMIGLLSPAACLVGVGCTCDAYMAVTLLVVGVGLSGAAFAGIKANFIDLAPKYAGLLLGMSTTTAMLPGIVAPYAIGVLTGGPHGQTMENWRVVFYITAASSTLAAVVYCIFGSGEQQPWDQPQLQLGENTCDFCCEAHDKQKPGDEGVSRC